MASSHDLTPPSLDDLAAMAEAELNRLRPALGRYIDGVPVQVAEFPDEETLREMGCESPFDLLGLFRGYGLAQQGAVPMSGQMPNMVFLYRRPILDYWAEHEETLGAIVTHVLVHEIGHHFGLSDEDMEAIEAAAG